MPQIDIDGAASRLSADNIRGQSGSTITIVSGHSLSGSGSGLTALNATQLTSGTIPIARIADDAVTTAKIAPDAITAAKIADDVINSEHYAAASIDNEHLADDAVGVAELSATGTASSSTFLRGDNAWAAAGGGKVVQYAKVKNTAAVQLSSTTMTDLTGVTVTLSNVTVGNILEITGIVPCRKNTGYYVHPGVGIKVDNTLIDNSTWGTGVHMLSSDIWILKIPLLTYHTATATSHTIKMCANAQSGQSCAFGGEMSGSTAHDYVKVWMIVKELEA